jgi:hypothetical protein
MASEGKRSVPWMIFKLLQQERSCKSSKEPADYSLELDLAWGAGGIQSWGQLRSTSRPSIAVTGSN